MSANRTTPTTSSTACVMTLLIGDLRASGGQSVRTHRASQLRDAPPLPDARASGFEAGREGLPDRYLGLRCPSLRASVSVPW
jgi:hypothetical protein